MTAWRRDDVRVPRAGVESSVSRREKQSRNSSLHTPSPSPSIPARLLRAALSFLDFEVGGREGERDRLSTSLLLQPAAISQLASARPSCPIGGACACLLYVVCLPVACCVCDLLCAPAGRLSCTSANACSRNQSYQPIEQTNSSARDKQSRSN